MRNTRRRRTSLGYLIGVSQWAEDSKRNSLQSQLDAIEKEKNDKKKKEELIRRLKSGEPMVQPEAQILDIEKVEPEKPLALTILEGIIATIYFFFHLFCYFW